MAFYCQEYYIDHSANFMVSLVNHNGCIICRGGKAIQWFWGVFVVETVESSFFGPALAALSNILVC